MYKRYCELRDAKGMTDTQVANFCGFSKTTLSDWKSGKISKPSTDKLIAIAQCLDVSTDYLLTGKEKTYSESMAVLANIRHDKAMMDALEKYLTLPDEKKKHIIETINMLFEG